MIRFEVKSMLALGVFALVLGGFGAAFAQEKVPNPDTLKVTYVQEKSAQPLPELQRQGLRPPMESDDQKAVFQGKAVYFDLHKGNEVHYTVESAKPLTKFVYTGAGFRNFSIQILDTTGLLLGSCGPYNYGDLIKTLEIPLPGANRVEVVITDHSHEWLLIKEISFQTGALPPLQ